MVESNIKYTTDGKKVAIVGKLNSEETIVQEIYVREDGSELPQGENFVVKSLLDEPAETWHEKKIKKLKAEYQAADKKHRYTFRELRTKREQAFKHIRELTQATHQQANMIEQKRVICETFTKFLRGDITHIVQLGWSNYEITTLDEFLIARSDYAGGGGLKLVTLYGKSNGKFEWGATEYKDGSGSSKTFIPCNSLEEAVDAIESAVRDNCVKGNITQYMIDAQKRYGLDYPLPEHKVKFYNKAVESQEKSVNYHKDNMDRELKKLIKIQKESKVNEHPR